MTNETKLPKKSTPPKQVFSLKVECNNEIEILSALVNLYATSVHIRKDRPPLRPKLVTVLAYYVKYGYNNVTKEMISKSLKVKKLNLNVMNSELTKLGFLLKCHKNLTNKNLNSELEKLSEFYKLGYKESIFAFFLNNTSK